jgi:hypothetical protein
MYLVNEYENKTKRVQYRDTKSIAKVTIVQEKTQGHCAETCGIEFVIFYYNDDKNKEYIINTANEFYSRYKKI